jgi:hypothetical protein
LNGTNAIRAPDGSSGACGGAKPNHAAPATTAVRAAAAVARRQIFGLRRIFRACSGGQTQTSTGLAIFFSWSPVIFSYFHLRRGSG